ncbi:hypothetical protein [Paraburkholderia dipogonis]
MKDARMRYSKEFFALQIRFARAVAALTDRPIGQVLLDYTNIYVRFGLGRAFDRDHPTWRCYAAGLSQTADISDWTYRFYLQQKTEVFRTQIVKTFGCFSYATQGPACVRIHFRNIEPAAISPLSIDRLPERLAELSALFDHVAHNQQEATRVAGTSWLYNLRAYRRCFPQAYVASAVVAEARFRNMPLWGQFLDRNGLVRIDAAGDFIRRLSNVKNVRDLASCFPLQALAVEAPIEDFYAFYGVAAGGSHG